MAIRHRTAADSSFSPEGKRRWEEDHEGDASDLEFVQSGTGATTRNAQAKMREIYSVDDFGALGDGTTNDAAAVQAAITAITAYGATHHVYDLTPSKVVRFTPGKTYLINSEISATFRNYMILDFTGAILKWGGSNDGRMFDCMGCNFLQVIGGLVDGNSALGQFLRVSGGNDAGLNGINNATGALFQNFVIRGMYTSGTKPFISTINDDLDYGDYSLHDSTFDNVWFRSEGYAAVELASSEIHFKSCEFISTTRGVIYRTGATARYTHCTWAGARYPHYVVADASVGDITNDSCYVEAVNAAGPIEGSFLYCESSGTTTAVKSFHINGGLMNQGAAANCTTSSKFIECANARASVYINGPRWQTTRLGKLDMGTNGRAFIRKSTLASAYDDFMPEIVGTAVFERIERDGGFFVSTPSVLSITLTVDSTGNDDYGALTFTTVDKAMALIDQLGATQMVIDIKSSLTLSTRRYVAGDLRITSSNASTLTFDEYIQVREGGSLTIDNITAIAGAATECILNRGGTVFANTLTVNHGATDYLVKHERGLTMCFGFTLTAGRMVNATSASGYGTVYIGGSNTYTSSDLVVAKSDSPIDVIISGTTPPTTGNWDTGIRVVDPSPASGAVASIVNVVAGSPGFWFNVGGIPLINNAGVGNVGGGEDDLQTQTIPANTLRASCAVRITAWGTTANNANPKTVKLLFGSATILTTALTVSQAGTWRINAEVCSTGSNAQDYVSQLVQGGATTLMDVEVGTATQTQTSAIAVKCTGTVTDGGGGINNNDIVQEGLIVEVIR